MCLPICMCGFTCACVRARVSVCEGVCVCLKVLNIAVRAARLSDTPVLRMLPLALCYQQHVDTHVPLQAKECPREKDEARSVWVCACACGYVNVHARVYMCVCVCVFA